MEKFARKNPWLGLESYKEGEILYGRDDDIRGLTQCVLNDTDTLLYGKSGIGKSSLLNAGILPAARRNGYLPVLIRLSHKETHSYLYQINQAIVNAILHSQTSDSTTDVSSANGEHVLDDVKSLVQEVVPCKNAEAESFYEYFHRHKFYNANGERIKLLIIFDQFEEIFTLQEDIQKKKTFFAHLADLLNDIMPDELQHKVDISPDKEEKVKVVQDADFENIFDDLNLSIENDLPEYITDNDIHFVFTIREDFLSEFEYYSAAIPSLKQNRYGLRPINEEQAAQIMLRPVPGLVDEFVARLIIEKITGKKDFKLDGVPEIEVDSAVLSLYLNRLYEAKDGETITKDLVEQKGGEIISDFYNDALSDISDSTIEYLEDMLLNGQGRRDNITVYDAIYDGKVSEHELDVLCNKKKILRQFNYAGDLRIEYVHDILCPIVNKNKSERRENAERERQNKKLKDLRRQQSIIITLLGIILLIGCVVGIGFFWPVTYRFASTTKKWGCVYGIERLSKKEASYRPYHYVFKKKGYFTKIYSSMECRDRFGNLSTNHTLSPYVVVGQMEDSILADGFKDKLQRVCKWEFIKDPLDEDLVIQERAYDKENNLVYAFNYNAPQKPKNEENKLKKDTEQKPIYYHENDGFKKMSIGSYVDGQGLPLELLKDGYRFIRITYDDNGRDMLVEYFDFDGNPSTNADGAYQTYYEYDDIGQCVSMSSLNMYGKRMIDNAGNCGQIVKYDGYRKLEILSIDEFGREKAVYNGYSRVMYDYDEHGREIKMSLWNKDKPICASGFHRRETVYDDTSNSLRQKCIDEDNKQISQFECRYDTHGNLLYYFEESEAQKTIQRSEYSTDGDCICQNEITIEGIDTVGVFNYEKNSNVEIRKFRGKMYNEYIRKTTYDDNDRLLEDVYYELDGETPYEDDYVYHRIVHFYTDNSDNANIESLFFKEQDSVIYYNIDGLNSIRVIERSPNRNNVIERNYDSDTIQNKASEKLVDMYGNTTEENQGLEIAYYFVNAKSNTQNGTAVAFLSRYKFPLPDFDFCVNADDGWHYYTCDENGDTSVSENYALPEIYSGERDTTAVFIQCTEQGRMWHAVILESDSGVKIGKEGYDYNNFSIIDDIVCLNLTTMRVETYKLYELDFWYIYEFPITQLEYDLYYEHYSKYYMESNIPVVYGKIEGDKGYLAEKGYTGEFFVLKWGDWECPQSIEAFSRIVKTCDNEAKDIVLLPYEIIDDKTVYHDIVYIENHMGKLGLHLRDATISKSYYQDNILNRYNEWKYNYLQRD